MSLSKSAIHGISWSSVSQFGRQGIQYVTTIILAALLLPSDFGLIAMALIVTGFLDLFKDLGLSAAIIQREETSKNLLSTVFWMNSVLGLILSVVIFYCAPFVADFYAEPRIDSILKVLSLVFFISGFSILQKTLLEKALNFKKLAQIELMGVLFGSSVGIILAIWGFGVWSLVFQSLFNSTITTFLIWKKSDFRPKLFFSLPDLRSLLGYSLNLAGYNLFNYFVRNADYLLIGKFLGNEALGHYYLAYKIMLYPVQNISGVISRVMFPIYSSIKKDLEKFRIIYINISKSIAAITFPLMLGVFIIANPFVRTFFNVNWNQKLLVNLIMILSPIGLIQSLASTTGSIYMSIGKTNYMFMWGIITGIIYVGGFLIGIQYGVQGVAISYLITTFIFLYPVFAIPFRFINLKTINYFKSFTIITISSLIMMIFGFAFLYFFESRNIAAIWQLIVLIPVSSLIYFLLLWTLDKNMLIEFFQRIKELRT